MRLKKLIPLLWLAMPLLITVSSDWAKATGTEILIDNNTPALQNQELAAGKIRVLVSYRPVTAEDTEADNPNLRYQLYYDNALQVENAVDTRYTGAVSLLDLDHDGSDEVIVKSFSGGAHCCTSYLIYGWQNGKFNQLDAGMFDGEGGEFKDLDHDGRLELLTYDNAFLYTFSSYAGSFPPSLILAYQNGQLLNVTRHYPQQLRSTAWQMYQAIEQRTGDSEINGVLAGYVAQKILLGEYEQGWNLMLARYDRNSDWGLTIYRNDQPIGNYPDFPTALRQFLITQGYLNAQAQPIETDPPFQPTP
jgi:hypothetical protein